MWIIHAVDAFALALAESLAKAFLAIAFASVCGLAVALSAILSFAFARVGVLASSFARAMSCAVAFALAVSANFCAGPIGHSKKRGQTR